MNFEVAAYLFRHRKKGNARPGVALIRRTYTNGYNTDHHVDVFLIVLYSASDHKREKGSSNVDEKPSEGPNPMYPTYSDKVLEVHEVGNAFY